MNITVDLNCDMGEVFGAHPSGNDEQLMTHITSANIACGFHSGDFSVMHRTVQLAIKHNVSVGAHPSLPDLQGFGRRNMNVTPAEVYDMMLYQVGSLHAFVVANHIKLHHVKPHGALYNMAAKDRKLADAIVDAIIAFDPSLILYGLAKSEMIEAAKSRKLPFCEEVFADRTYQPDGSLTPRNQPNALIEDVNESLNQVMRMVTTRSVSTPEGKSIPLEPGTICIHGDGAHAVDFALTIHNKLKAAGVNLASPKAS
jgi:5-oxoprolinase (ATP-hydrolysing) subunit A